MSTTTVQTKSLTLPYKTQCSSQTEPQDALEENRIDSPLVEEELCEKSISVPAQESSILLPQYQNVLLLFGPRQPYTLTGEWPIPTPRTSTELVVKIQAIGLNPFDWKSVDYNFGIPELPYLAGRDFAGVVVKAASGSDSLKAGDLVIGTSTDYRDLRKAAFQEYAIANSHNVSRLPSTVTLSQGASLGVAYVAAVIALGVCLGLDYSRCEERTQGPDLWQLVRDLPSGSLPADVLNECLNGIGQHERPQTGDWIAIWGGSSTSALFLSQLAQLARLRVILVVDLAKHGARLLDRGGNVVVDGHDPSRAVNVIRALTGNSLRFAIDTVGNHTAAHLLDALTSPPVDSNIRSHIVGLSGLPKTQKAGVVNHMVPIKVFHESQIIGSTMMEWLEKLLAAGLVVPDIVLAQGGLDGINAALDRMRKGEISGRRLVVPLE